MKNNVGDKIKKGINKIFNSELFIIIIGLVLFFKAIIFYQLTIYISESVNVELIAKTFIFSMLMVAWLFLLKNRARFVCGLIMDLLISSIMFADNLYYNYSASFISVAQISNLQYSEQISASIGELLQLAHILYFIDIVIILAMLIFKIIKLEKIKEWKWKTAAVYVVIMIVVFGTTIPSYVHAAEEYKYNKNMQLELGTLYSFHYLDVKSIVNMRKNIKYKSKDEVMNAYNNLKNTYNEKYAEDVYGFNDIAKDKNVIVLQLESFQNYLYDKKINGKEITPNLNKFLKENIYIKNMMSQSYTTTADSEHSTFSSLYPLENGMAFAQYSGNKYDDFFGEFDNAGFYTIYMHGNYGSFWNRTNVYGNMNVDEIDFLDKFDQEKSTYINEWLSDESLFNQAIDKLNNAEKPFFANIVTASSHTAFDLPGLENKYDYVDIDVGKYKGTYFGDYLESMNYTDKQFGTFIQRLKDTGLYDNTVILLFGDHYGVQMHNYEMLEFIEQNEHQYNNVDTEINYINVLCGIRIPGCEHKEIEKIVSKLDIKPTLCKICGVEDGVSLGANIFGDKDFVCLNNGIIVTENYYYNGKWHYRSNGEEVDTQNIDAKLKEKLEYYVDCMNEELTISNSMILNNLLAK
ncbi:MAG: LTA synthase family protein [Clostridia bacterium]|nr:LTA synthase family protein [Clostridia bacterium]